MSELSKNFNINICLFVFRVAETVDTLKRSPDRTRQSTHRWFPLIATFGADGMPTLNILVTLCILIITTESVTNTEQTYKKPNDHSGYPSTNQTKQNDRPAIPYGVPRNKTEDLLVVDENWVGKLLQGDEVITGVQKTSRCAKAG